MLNLILLGRNQKYPGYMIIPLYGQLLVDKITDLHKVDLLILISHHDLEKSEISQLGSLFTP